MLELFYWPTPNGHKITLFLEEAGVPYQIYPVNIGAGDQFKPEFLAVSPNNRIPAIRDGQITMFESGAILLYLAEKHGRFCPASGPERGEVLQWLFWQMGGLGPMAGQNHHFAHYAKEKIPYAIDRYVTETGRLYRVLNEQLSKKPFVAGEYSIADMAIYPWVVLHDRQGQDLAKFPAIRTWFETIRGREATKRAYEKGKAISAAATPVMDDARRAVLFGQK